MPNALTLANMSAFAPVCSGAHRVESAQPEPPQAGSAGGRQEGRGAAGVGDGAKRGFIFPILLSIRGHKWGSSTTPLTLPIGTTKRIQSDPLTSLTIERLQLHRTSCWSSIRKGFIA